MYPTAVGGLLSTTMVWSEMLLFLALFGFAESHLCLLNPGQRGTSDITIAGSLDCGLTTPPCGNRAPQQPTIQFDRNSLQYFVVQKNLDHYCSDNPGNFTFNIVIDNNPPAMAGYIRDVATGPLTLDYVRVKIPATGSSKAYVQAIYYPNGGVPAFYQCADIIIN